MTYKFPENIQRGILFLTKTEEHFMIQTQNLIKPEHFEFLVHSLIYDCVVTYYRKFHKLPPDDFILERASAQMVGNKKFVDISISDISNELDEINGLDASYIENQDYYLDLTESYARRAAISDAIKESIDLIHNNRYEEVEEKVREALLVTRHIDVGQQYFDHITTRYNKKEAGEVIKFPTVLKTVTANLDGGNSPKELCMVVAPPGTGKSLYLVNQAAKIMMENKKVLYISLEMSEDKIAARFDSVISRIPINSLNSGAPALIGLNKTLNMFKEHFPASDLIIKEFPTGMANVNSIRTLLYNLKNMKNFVPDVIIVDYLELLRPIRIIDSEYAAQQRIAEELRGLAVEKSILLWTATQPNREGKKVQIITDAQLGDSYGKIRVADFAISINQTDTEYDNGCARVYVMKARDAKQRYIVNMKIDYSTLVMTQGAAITEEDDQESLEDVKKQLKTLTKQA